MKRYGQDKVLFGINYFMIIFVKCLEYLDNLELIFEVRNKFFFENVVRVFEIEVQCEFEGDREQCQKKVDLDNFFVLLKVILEMKDQI